MPSNHADEIVALCRRIDDHEYGRRVVVTYKADVVALHRQGIVAHDEGGMRAMLLRCREASLGYPNAANTLNVHWNGIGEWQH